MIFSKSKQKTTKMPLTVSSQSFLSQRQQPPRTIDCSKASNSYLKQAVSRTLARLRRRLRQKCTGLPTPTSFKSMGCTYAHSTSSNRRLKQEVGASITCSVVRTILPQSNLTILYRLLRTRKTCSLQSLSPTLSLRHLGRERIPVRCWRP